MQERQGIMDRLSRTELAVSNAVGPAAAQYFKHLEKFLYRIPSNIMGLPIFQLIKVTESNAKSQQVSKHFIKVPIWDTLERPGAL